VQDEERQQYWTRLADLERELRRVQQELALERPRVQLPEGRFEAVRLLIGRDEYGVPCGFVREIVRYARLTRIPGALDVIAGALNFRGTIVPVVDVPRRLGVGQTRIDLKTPIVVVDIHGSYIGLLVDRVGDVVVLDGALLERAQGGLASSPFVAATASVLGRFLQLLDLGEIISRAELAALENEVSGAAANDIDDGWEGEAGQQ
jgi:purine-binding chemotaxis protein CheW